MKIKSRLSTLLVAASLFLSAGGTAQAAQDGFLSIFRMQSGVSYAAIPGIRPAFGPHLDFGLAGRYLEFFLGLRGMIAGTTNYDIFPEVLLNVNYYHALQSVPIQIFAGPVVGGTVTTIAGRGEFISPVGGLAAAVSYKLTQRSEPYLRLTGLYRGFVLSNAEVLNLSGVTVDIGVRFAFSDTVELSY